MVVVCVVLGDGVETVLGIEVGIVEGVLSWIRRGEMVVDCVVGVCPDANGVTGDVGANTR